jgi:predicted deacylase
MSQPEVRKMALLQNADIIVNNPPSDGTLRGAAEEAGIHAITLEVGNPNIFQRKMIRSGVEGIHNVLCHLNMIDDDIIPNEKETILCKSSYWIYTDEGGLLTVKADLLDNLEKGLQIATLRNIFGSEIKTFLSPENGIVIGKSISPVNQAGGRILHIGTMEK